MSISPIGSANIPPESNNQLPNQLQSIRSDLGKVSDAIYVYSSQPNNEGKPFEQGQQALINATNLFDKIKPELVSKGFGETVTALTNDLTVLNGTGTGSFLAATTEGGDINPTLATITALRGLMLDSENKV